MILCFVGCSDNAEPTSIASYDTSSSNNVQSCNSSVQNQKQIIKLTTVNINDYIIFST